MNEASRQDLSDKIYDIAVRHPYLCALCACLSMLGVNLTGRKGADVPILITVFSVICMIALCVGAVFLIMKAPKDKRLLVLIVAMGFFMRIAYVIYTTSFNWQHDVASFDDAQRGHGTYIYHLYNGMLPQIDVSNTGQFYHPPLHHALSVLWIKVQELFGISFYAACENIQLLTTFYSCACMISAYKIARLADLRALGASVCVAVIALHPSFFILSSSVNNDMLCITLMLTALLWVFRWYRDKKMSSIILTALSIGGAMTAKLSGAYVAFPVAFIFLIVLIGAIRKKKSVSISRLLPQYGVFAVICIPLGLWWQIRSKIVYDLPLTYVPSLEGIKFLDISGHTAFERFFDLSNLTSPFTRSGWLAYCEGHTLDWNIPLAMMKTALFGEYTLGWGSVLCEILAWVLLISSSALAVIALIFTFYSLIRSAVKPKNTVVYDVSLFIFYAVILLLYIKFCFDFPQNCTMDFRYIVPVLLTSGFFLGKAVDNGNGMLKYGVLGATGIFCASSVLFYLFGMLSIA